MAIVRIAQTNTAVSWTAPNIDSMVLRTSSPVTEISLPEHGTDEAYVVKFSGNAMVGNITSIIKEQKISPFRGLSHNPTSVFGQMRALHQTLSQLALKMHIVYKCGKVIMIVAHPIGKYLVS